MRPDFVVFNGRPNQYINDPIRGEGGRPCPFLGGSCRPDASLPFSCRRRAVRHRLPRRAAWKLDSRGSDFYCPRRWIVLRAGVRHRRRVPLRQPSIRPRTDRRYRSFSQSSLSPGFQERVHVVRWLALVIPYNKIKGFRPTDCARESKLSASPRDTVVIRCDRAANRGQP